LSIKPELRISGGEQRFSSTNSKWRTTSHEAAFLLVSESLWNEVRKGDTVTISGVRSVLGQSINGVEKTKTEEAPIEPKTPKLRWGPQTQESPPDPETPKFRWGK
jgi:hypothetical protein